MTPTGPSITYKALPFPLPPAERELLKRLSSEIYDAKGKTYAEAPAEREARQALDIATLQMRERIGVGVYAQRFTLAMTTADAALNTIEVIRPSFLLAGDLRTNFRKTEGAG